MKRNLRKETWFQKICKFVCRYTQPYFTWKVGDKVVDDLTSTVATVVGVEWAMGRVPSASSDFINYMGSMAVWLDNEWLDGGRHPWEISDPIPTEDIPKWEEALLKERTERQAIKTARSLIKSKDGV